MTVSCIEPGLRDEICASLRDVRDAFGDKDDISRRIGERTMPVDHWLAIPRIEDSLKSSMADSKILMLCGVCDFAFTAGEFGYTNDQYCAINRLGDAICELERSIGF